MVADEKLVILFIVVLIFILEIGTQTTQKGDATHMRKNNNGLGAGLAALGIIGVSALIMNKDKMMTNRNKRAIKKNVNKAVKNVSSFVDEMGNMMR